MTPIAFSVRRDQLTIRGEYCLPDGLTPGQRCPVLFMNHCFGGNYDGMHVFAKPFLEQGYAAFWFDFCGGGVVCRSDGRQEEITFASELADLNAVIEYALTLPFVDGNDLSLLGESMGGVIAVLAAAQGRYTFRQLVLISPAFCAPDDARRGCFGGVCYPLDDVPALLSCPNGMTLSRAFHEEASALDIFEAMRAFHGPVLLIHGVADSVVPFAYAIRASQTFPDCMLHLVEQMDHCCMSPEQAANAQRLIRLFLRGKREVLTIAVQVTHVEQQLPDGTRPDRPIDGAHEDFINAVYFTGYCRCPAFTGAICAGAVDRQSYHEGRQIRLCADYTLDGVDSDGCRCHVHIVNTGLDGDWTPMIETDSKALAWLNTAQLTAVLELHAGGLNVCIFG